MACRTTRTSGIQFKSTIGNYCCRCRVTSPPLFAEMLCTDGKMEQFTLIPEVCMWIVLGLYFLGSSQPIRIPLVELLDPSSQSVYLRTVLGGDLVSDMTINSSPLKKEGAFPFP